MSSAVPCRSALENPLGIETNDMGLIDIDDNQLDSMREGLVILWKVTNEAVIKRISSGTFSIILTEWRNRQIRRMVEQVWSRVKKLKRVRIENIELWHMKHWEYRHLSKWELSELFTRLNLENLK